MSDPQSFHETFHNEAVSLPSDRSTGVVFSVVALIVAFVWRDTQTVLWTALGASSALLFVAILKPKLLRPLNIVWFKFGLLLHRIVNPVVMFAIYACVIVPAGLIMQLFRDPLRKKRETAASTYWIDKTQEPEQMSSMSNQF